MPKIIITLIILLTISKLVSSTSPPSFCEKIKPLENPFPEVNTKDTFYFKKIFDNNYIIGTENSATQFKLSPINSQETSFTFEQYSPLDSNYFVYADAFGNINPIFALDNTDNPSKLKYILTEGITTDNEYIHALYDVENNLLQEGKLSDTFPDFKILEVLNENEYIGAVKLYDSNTNVYSIKLQLMSFNQISEGRIKLLSAKEYAKVENEQHIINNIFYVKNLKKIMLIRTYEKNIYIDFIDYFGNSFGSILTTKNILSDFDISEYKFNSIILKTEYEKTYIITCFRKLNYLYCFSGYYDTDKNDFILLQEKPKLMMSSCDSRKRPDINLSKLNSELGIVGCPGKNYKAIRFDINLEKIGSEITFPRTYSEFAVINDYSLFVLYREENSVDNKYYLHGCVYYLPVCEDKKVFFKLDNNPHSLEEAFGVEENLINMKNIYIVSFLETYGSCKIYNNQNSPYSLNVYNNREDLYYKYSPSSGSENSFEDQIIYKTVVNPSDPPDSNLEAFSKECTLKIVNCYKSCNECDAIGDTNSHNCLKCKLEEDLSPGESPYYFLDDPSSKICINYPPDNYYLDNSDPNNIYYKKCYESCKNCSNSGTTSQHNCVSCYQSKNYFEFNSVIDEETSSTLLNCYLDVLPPEGFYFDKNRDPTDPDYTTNPYFKPCGGNCLRCDQDLKESTEEQPFCKICDTKNEYYALFENDDSKKFAKCLNELPVNYFLDRDAGRYRKCYPSCATCSQRGSDEFNNCDTCKRGFSRYVIDSKTCKCEYNFYYKLDSNDNFESFECTEDFECPNEYPYLIINSQNLRQCVKECPKDYPYKYNYQCFNHKLNGTSSQEGNEQDLNDNSNIDNTQCIINDYIVNTIPKEDVTKITQDYVNNYINEYTNSLEKDYTYNHANVIRNEDGEYVLLVFQNEQCLKKVLDEYGMNFIDLTEYAPTIKSKNGIDPNDPLTYVYLYSDDEDVNKDNQNIEYECYNSKTGEKLDLDEALKDQLITEHVPAPSGNDLKKLEYLSKYSDLGIDFSDPNSDFFNSQCFQFSSDKGKDVTLADRRKYFFNNIKICEDECIFNGIDESTNTAKCDCPYQKGSTAVVKKEVTFPDYNEEYFIYDMWKCLSKKMVKGKELKKSYITIIVFCILLLTILFTILYFVFLKNKFQFLSKVSDYKFNGSSTNTLSNKNNNNSLSNPKRSQTIKTKKIAKKLIGNPPKNETEKGSDNMNQEKGYVRDAKRPFNYDSNNLFFHADENYTIGNQNLNSLFMGQNFKNDYSKEIEQFQNDEKKPKEVINNYNNINVPGNRVYKKNKTAFPRVNNFNNINYSSNLFKIDEESPIKPNKNNNNVNPKNDLLYLKENSDGNSTDPFRNEDNQKRIELPKEKEDSNYNNMIPEINSEEQIEDYIKKAGNEIGEENMKINIAEYEYAKKYDFRDFCSFYFNQLKHRQIFFYTGYYHSLAEGLFMKIIVIFFHILVCLFFNLFWYRTSYVHDEFISPINNHAKFSSKYAWFRILLSVACYIVVICLLHLLYLPQLKIYYTLVDEKLDYNKKAEIIKNKIKCMKINYIIFVILNFCFLIVLVLYTLVFSYVFINSKTDLMISFIITFVITQALPFIFVFFVTCFRFIGLKCDSPCAYKFSLFFTI